VNRKGKGRRPVWDAARVRALRGHLGLSQQALADEMGVRQQTISEWETSLYRPRGASARLLTLVAERASFAYRASAAEDEEKHAR
jgi:DNA-binding transcriptional regulator YiaG